jgi:hypothetical protein
MGEHMSRKAKTYIAFISNLLGFFILGTILIYISKNYSFQAYSEVPLTLWLGYGLIFIAGASIVILNFVSHYKDNHRSLSRIWFILMHVFAIYILGIFCFIRIADSFQFTITYENYWTVFPLKQKHDELVFLLKDVFLGLGIVISIYLTVIYYGVMNAIKK